jgi:dinuclear metal center YbgI/SA1388 family protein
MTTVSDIYDFLDGKAPFSLQMSFDNAGFLVGDGTHPVTKILVSLDITEEVIREAKELGAELIVSHHPVIFFPAKRVTADEPLGRKLIGLIQNDIAAICCHTNLDAVADGVNDALAERAGLTKVEQLHQDGVDGQGRPYGIGRVGELTQEMPLSDYLSFLKRNLAPNGVRYADAGRPVRRVAVGGGACADMMKDALDKGCDTFVTSDVKYDGFLDAEAWGINLVDAGHFPTENVVCPRLVEWLQKAFPELTVEQSRRHHEVITYSFS